MMKKNLYKLGLLSLLVGFTACEKELPMYASEECMLNFVYSNTNISSSEDVEDADRQINFSFVLDSSVDAEQDTVWLTVQTMGYLTDYDRPISLVQVATGNNDAVAGKHFVSLTDATLSAKYYVVPANTAEVDIPIVVLRDASLSEESVTLKLTFQANEYFSNGYDAFQEYTITITDKLTKPQAWDDCWLDYYFGEYGEVKHALMIEWTGKAWDDEYIYGQCYQYTYSGGTTYWFANDADYWYWLDDWFQEKLEAANAANGTPYTESDGTLVDFTPL